MDLLIKIIGFLWVVGLVLCFMLTAAVILWKQP